MNHQTIRIEGSILSPDILDKIENDDISGQLSKDFGFESKVKVKDEIAKAWADANSQWKVFKSRIEKVKEGETGTSETRKYWMIPFLGLLGYDVVGANAEHINGKSYSISHRDKNLDRFPVHIMGFNDSLDKKRSDSGPRLSPHSLVQEYLNLTEHLFALVTNGYTIRLLRDSSRLIKLSYIEFDLERMFEEDHYSDFAVMFRLLHSSRMPVSKEQTSDSLIEKYHQDALDSGSRIRDGLSAAVRDSILKLGAGFLNHSPNEELINLIDNNKLDYDQYHRYLLRIIYRLLFIMVIEERGLVYSEKTNSDLKNIYYDYYSIGRLRKLCERRFIENEKYTDYWIHILNCFKIFEDEKFGKSLDIKPLAGDLFGYDAIGELNNCNLNNEVVIECIKNLSFFRNVVTGQIMRVNYRSLNVEEFGSVYEGLLEFKPHIKKVNGKYDYNLVKGSERSSSGSHYTEDELVTPLIKHSLDYIIEDKLKENNPEKALLSITVCDVACGSGHILLNAARRIAFELAKVRTGEDFPSPTSYRIATRDVIKNCIYGVDKNPLAVELCKIALWLESHNPGEPLSFLDHKIKCGDSIVGLAHKEELLKGIPIEAFNRMLNDDKNICLEFKKSNKLERSTREKQKQIPIEFKNCVDSEIKAISSNLSDVFNLPESTPEEVEVKKQRYLKLNSGSDWWKLKNLADILVAQFFIPKTEENKDKLITDEKYYQLLQQKQILGDFLYKATTVSQEKKFFHWFLEFPEIFENGGFDCILGNPPYLGGQKISGIYGDKFLELIKYEFAPIGAVDLVTYFFRRIFSILNDEGFLSLISTNSISQGGSREYGLDIIVQQGGIINYAIKSTRWPGVAAVEVSLVSITKKSWSGKYILNNKEVNIITPYLDNVETIGNPYMLIKNEGISFQGSIVLGSGFLLTPSEANELINKDIKNKDVLFPYLNGIDLNNNPDQFPSRWVINFFNWPLKRYSQKDWLELPDKIKENINERLYCGLSVQKVPHWYGEKTACDYPDCIKIIEDNVKSERIKMKGDRGAEYWWQFLRSRNELYKTISEMEKVLVIPETTKYLSFSYYSPNFVFSHMTKIIAIDKFSLGCFICSSIHDEWARKYSSTLGGTLKYITTEGFQTYPIPNDLTQKFNEKLENIGEQYHRHRKKLMLNLQLGITKILNLFHCQGIIEGKINEKEKQVHYLKKHLIDTKIKSSFDEAIKGILFLRELHKKMDEAVLEAYEWTDINLRHDFYEVDYLPENDRIRYTIHPDARKEILKHLLELNHKIHEEEVAAGLWDKKTTKTKKPKDDYPDSVNEAQGKIF